MKTNEIKIGTHGFVRYVDHMGTDLRIVEAARISYNSPSKGDEQDKKLLHYLFKNKHTSPFEMCKITLNVRLPIFVMRQWVRHRMQNLNEVSARYTELPDDFYIPNVWRRNLGAGQNKQQSVALEIEPTVELEDESGEWTTFGATEALEAHNLQCYKLYQAMLKGGIARELARMVLPVNIYTEIYCCWDLKNLLHFIALRDDSHAQAEIQDYSAAIKVMLRELFPWTMEIYDSTKQP